MAPWQRGDTESWREDLYSKTARGLVEVTRKKLGLSRIARQVLNFVDGKSNFADLLALTENISSEELTQALNDLLGEGLIRQILATEEEPDFAYGETSISVAELDPEEGVRAWAEAQRCAQALRETGFYAIHEGHSFVGKEPQVLVVEDTASTAEMEMLLLRREGFAARHAANGKEAAEILETMIPDLVLLDVNLPDTSGFKILETLRNHPRLKHLPVIMVTSQVGEEDVLAGIRGGADGYIFKPFPPKLLIQCIRKVLKTSAQTRQSP
jgi:CheY-like chemotaxis protein/DNA-binding HxlR family transcriptional regulator